MNEDLNQIFFHVINIAYSWAFGIDKFYDCSPTKELTGEHFRKEREDLEKGVEVERIYSQGNKIFS